MKQKGFLKMIFTVMIMFAPGWGRAQSIMSIETGMDNKIYAFTLEEAIDFGQQRRADIKNQQLTILIGQTQIEQSKSFFYPKINGTIDSRLNTRLQTSVLPAGVFSGPAGSFREIQFGTHYNTLSSLDLNAVLWDEAAVTDVKIARNNLEANKEQLNKSLTATKLNIAEAYYMVLINKEHLKLLACELAGAQRYLEEGKQKKINGTIANSDLDKLELAVKRDLSENERNSNIYQLSKEFLLNQLGLSFNNEIQLKDSLVNLNDFDDKEQSVKDRANSAYINRPEYKLEALNLSLAHLNLLKEKKDELPKLSLYGTFATQAMRTNFDLLNFNKQWYPYNYIGLKLTLSIFDGLKHKYIKREYVLEEQISRNNLADQQLNLTYEYHTALSVVQFNSSNIQNELRNMENAKRFVQLSELRFKEGVINLSDLLNNEKIFFDTENSYLRSLYDYYMAKLNLKKAMGIL